MLWWNESLRTGDDSIDAQHKKIFLLGERVLDLNEESTDKDITKTFCFLIEYTKEHFKDEEQLMQKHQYDDYTNHKKLHQHFVKELHELLGSFKARGITEENIDQLKVMMVGWLMNHINDEDKRFIERIR